MNMQYTKREYDCLLAMRRKPRTFAELKRIAKVSDDAMNIMTSEMGGLYYVVDGELTTKGKLTLNQQGETVAQAEFDRRFDMYYTRIMSLLALLTSIVALILAK